MPLSFPHIHFLPPSLTHSASPPLLSFCVVCSQYWVSRPLLWPCLSVSLSWLRVLQTSPWWWQLFSSWLKLLLQLNCVLAMVKRSEPTAKSRCVRSIHDGEELQGQYNVLCRQWEFLIYFKRSWYFVMWWRSPLTCVWTLLLNRLIVD